MLANQNQNDELVLGDETSTSEELNHSPHEKQEENVPAQTFHENKIFVIRRILKNVQESIQKIETLLGDSSISESEEESHVSLGQMATGYEESENSGNERVIEGVFNGQNMIGQDGKEYNVPPNYASKSKLVEGDLLKLTIDTRGRFIYKQIGPIEKSRVVGTLDYDNAKNQYCAVVPDGTRWKLLMAPVTYYKGETGDEVVILVPKNSISQWAAVENIIKKYEV